MRWYEINQLDETASAGSTSSGNIATSVGASKKDSLGSGFDPDGDWGVYPKRKNTKEPQEKATLLRR